MWSLLLPALAIAGGTYLAATTNKNAAATATAGITQAEQTQQATDAAIAQQAAQNAQSGGTGPGVNYLRSLVAQPGTLTPEQQSQLADLRLSTTNQLHGSDFAGSGRTAAALFKKTEDDFTNTALQNNKTNAINAADKLASGSTTATGQQIQALEQGAQAGSNAATSIANIDANTGIATGKVFGAALGDVASLINRQNKQNSNPLSLTNMN